MLTLSAFCLVLGLVMLSDDQRRTASNRIREALRIADLSITKAALHMNYCGPADFEHCLSGDQKMDVYRLVMLPDVFHQNYFTLGAIHYGLPEHVRRAVKMGLPEALELKKEA